MMRHLLTIAWLTVVWMALWEEATWANLAGGVAAGAFVTVLVPGHRMETAHGFRPLALLRLAVYFAWELIEASAIIAWEVITPGLRTSPTILAVPLHSRSPRIVTMVANMVSLTPGTLTLEVEEETMTLLIHVLHFGSVIEDRRAVQKLESLALAAFPPREAHPLPSQRGERG
ncbi:MAG: Na+/H+ antiporter subunit E [Actinomycetota bacterium]